MDELTAELARRFAAAYISATMGTSFATEYKKLTAEPGEYWMALARAVAARPPGHGAA
jgi:hypothetical protein